MPQSGIRAICYPGPEPDYATRADEDLRGPMVPLKDANGNIVEIGLVEQAWDRDVRLHGSTVLHWELACSRGVSHHRRLRKRRDR